MDRSPGEKTAFLPLSLLLGTLIDLGHACGRFRASSLLLLFTPTMLFIIVFIVAFIAGAYKEFSQP